MTQEEKAIEFCKEKGFTPNEFSGELEPYNGDEDLAKVMIEFADEKVNEYKNELVNILKEQKKTTVNSHLGCYSYIIKTIEN